MKQILALLERFRQAGDPTVLATVVATRGSTYRKPGAHMVLTDSGTVVGSVSGAAWKATCWRSRGRKPFPSGRPGWSCTIPGRPRS